MSRHRPLFDPLATPLDERGKALRRLALGAMVKAGRGHPASALSLIEILRVLYDDVLKVRPAEPRWPERDRLILSKGHGCLALYAILADKGFFLREVLDTFCGIDSPLGGHPEFGAVPGIEASTGALGHGLSIGVGMALAARMDGRDSRVFVILGDGELNEGAVWEAALSAGKHRLDCLVALIDYNRMQSYGPLAEVQPLDPLAAKWESFGFAVAEVDGHDVPSLRRVLSDLPLAVGQPSVVICHTVKGKGVPAAENNPAWHHKNRLSEDELAQVVAALGSA
jgi:transketolase